MKIDTTFPQCVSVDHTKAHWMSWEGAICLGETLATLTHCPKTSPAELNLKLHTGILISSIFSVHVSPDTCYQFFNTK